MNDYHFILNFALPGREGNPEQYLDALYDAGCDDAAVGVGQYGMIGLDFARAAASAGDAIRSAIENVRAAIPGAALMQAGPDLMGLTEMSEIFRFQPAEHAEIRHRPVWRAGGVSSACGVGRTQSVASGGNCRVVEEEYERGTAGACSRRVEGDREGQF